ncbi:MAG: universal stress protein, partial [Solirubrobacterales bacterium]
MPSQMAIKRIVVAVDGTPASLKAAEVALDIAEPAGSEVT